MVPALAGLCGLRCSRHSRLEVNLWRRHPEHPGSQREFRMGRQSALQVCLPLCPPGSRPRCRCGQAPCPSWLPRRRVSHFQGFPQWFSLGLPQAFPALPGHQPVPAVTAAAGSFAHGFRPWRPACLPPMATSAAPIGYGESTLAAETLSLGRSCLLLRTLSPPPTCQSSESRSATARRSASRRGRPAAAAAAARRLWRWRQAQRRLAPPRALRGSCPRGQSRAAAALWRRRCKGRALCSS